LRDLKEMVAGGESKQVEFKRSTGQRLDGIRTVCAMLNGGGGYVFFGVTDKGEIVGQQVSSRTIDELSNELRRIEPPVFPEIEIISLGTGLSVIAIQSSSTEGPYTFDGRPYIRHASTTRVMPRSVYENRLLEMLHATHRWENQPAAAGVSVDDLDEEEILITVDNAVQKGRLEPPKKRDIKAILRGLGLIADGKLLNAAIALYGRSDKVKSLYMQCAIRLARFRGINRLADFTDNRQYWGNAFSLLRRAESFLLDHMPIAGRVVSGKMQREDRPLYPPLALREAIANALCHRDYTIPGGAVSVAMYDNHLEVTNPGALHFGITPEKLLQPHESRPWNPIIASVFYRAGIIEQWGSGTLKIIDLCRTVGVPDPAWSEQSGSVITTFSAPEWFAEKLQVPTPQVTPQVTGEVMRLLPLCITPTSRKELQEELGLKDIEHFRKVYLLPALVSGFIERTIPDKPQSSKQRYRLT